MSRPVSVLVSTDTAVYACDVAVLWKRVLTESRDAVQQQTKQTVDRKRKRDERPYALLAELMQQLGANAHTPIHELLLLLQAHQSRCPVDTAYDVELMRTQLQDAFANYKKEFVLCANDQYFIPKTASDSGFTNDFFRLITLDNAITNDAYRRYMRTTDAGSYQLLLDTAYYLESGRDPLRTGAPHRQRTAQTEVGASLLSQSLFDRIQERTSTYFTRLAEATQNNSQLHNQIDVLQNQVISRLHAVVKRLQQTVQYIEKDPTVLVDESLDDVYHQSITAASKVMLSNWLQTVKSKDKRAIQNTIVKYTNEREKLVSQDSDTYETHIKDYIEQYTAAAVHQILVDWKSVVRKCFDKCLQFTDETVTELNDCGSVIDAVVREAAVQVAKEFQKDCTVFAAASEKSAVAPTVSPAVVRVVHLACTKMDLSAYTHHISKLVEEDAENGAVVIEQQLKLVDTLEMIPSAFQTWNNKVVDARTEAIRLVQQKAREEVADLMKDIETWYLVHVQRLISACEAVVRRLESGIEELPQCEVSETQRVPEKTVRWLQQQLHPLIEHLNRWYRDSQAQLPATESVSYRTSIHELQQFDSKLGDSTLAAVWQQIQAAAQLQGVTQTTGSEYVR